MANDTTKTAPKSLSDEDMKTYARRAGPTDAGAGTDVDTHSESDAEATDHDTAVATDSDS